MARPGKYLSIYLVAILATTILLIVLPSDALTVAKPSVPIFTLELGNGFIEIKIQNQQLILTADNESLYYNIRVKTHLSDQWVELYSINSPDLPTLKGTIPIQSDSQYTILTYSTASYSSDTQLDFQAQAMYGHYYIQEPGSQSPFVPDIIAFGVFADGESGWSDTQTITIPSTIISPSPTVPEFPVATLLALAIIPLTILLIKRKSKWVGNMR
jgi:hypothetical protein